MPYTESKAQRMRRKLRYARYLRKHMTPTETILWEALRNRKLNGLKFRRQVPISWFIVDFLCMEYSLIVEIDGAIHNEQQEYDNERDIELSERGFRILRIKNEEVLRDLPMTLQKISTAASGNI